jgi:hypothetical protein
MKQLRRAATCILVGALLASGCSSIDAAQTASSRQTTSSAPKAAASTPTPPPKADPDPEPAPAPAPQIDDSSAWRAAISSCTVDAYGFALVTGQVANDSSRTRSYQVSIVLDGSNGLRAGSGSATASSVPSGGVGPFEFRTSVSSTSGGITDCRIDRVSPN